MPLPPPRAWPRPPLPADVSAHDDEQSAAPELGVDIVSIYMSRDWLHSWVVSDHVPQLVLFLSCAGASCAALCETIAIQRCASTPFNLKDFLYACAPGWTCCQENCCAGRCSTLSRGHAPLMLLHSPTLCADSPAALHSGQGMTPVDDSVQIKP